MIAHCWHLHWPSTGGGSMQPRADASSALRHPCSASHSTECPGTHMKGFDGSVFMTGPIVGAVVRFLR